MTPADAALVAELRTLADRATRLADGLQHPTPGLELWPADVQERLGVLAAQANALAREHRWSRR